MINMQDLIKRIEAAEGASRELDWMIAEHIGNVAFAMESTLWPPFMVGSKMDKDIPPYTSSIDAAMTLVPDGMVGRIGYGPDGSGFNWAFCTKADAWEVSTVWAKTPALALCDAALRARNG